MKIYQQKFEDAAQFLGVVESLGVSRLVFTCKDASVIERTESGFTLRCPRSLERYFSKNLKLVQRWAAYRGVKPPDVVVIPISHDDLIGTETAGIYIRGKEFFCDVFYQKSVNLCSIERVQRSCQEVLGDQLERFFQSKEDEGEYSLLIKLRRPVSAKEHNRLAAKLKAAVAGIAGCGHQAYDVSRTSYVVIGRESVQKMLAA